MAGTRSHVEVVAPLSGAIDSQTGRDFFQARLGIYALWNCVLSFAFIPIRLAGELRLDPSLTLARFLTAPSVMIHLLASGGPGVVWLLTRSRTLAPRTLEMLDAVMTIGVGALYAGMGALLTRGGTRVVAEPRLAMFTVTLAIVHTMIWRAVAMPTPPSRTALLTSLAVAPLIVADIVTLRGLEPSGGEVAPMFAASWAVLCIVTSTVAASIIYGLRREVQRGRRLGQYTLDEKIGEGAMGVVYRANHAMLRRPTAIKLLAAGRAGTADLQRFEREVQLTATLTHPNNVAIYDYGRTPDGVFYYAMEFLDGINLEDLVRRCGPQPGGRVIHIMRQVCRALAEAHGLGVIHRDVKPANIILTVRGGDPDVAKIVDFGLVKRLDADSMAMTVSIDAGQVLAGTPLYFSPETISSPDEVEARSDLYSLGAVGYYLVTGQPLFEAPTIMALCMHHLKTPPIPPSIRLGRSVDAQLEALILQCLAKSAGERPASARALEQALGECPAAKEWSTDEARQWWAAHAEDARPLVEPQDTGSLTVAVDLQTR